MKNKFLLLGATALLSTGALMANADFNSAPIGAEVSFASPSVATQGDIIIFGDLDPNVGGTLTVNPNGTFDGSAKVIVNGGINSGIQSGSIKFSGGLIPSFASDAFSYDAVTETYLRDLNPTLPNNTDQFLVELALDDARIDMYKGGDKSRPSCGYVDNLTQGNDSWDGTYYTLRIGGTLNLEFDEGYANSDGSYDTCSGSTTVTYVLKLWY